MALRLLVADDHAMVREGLRMVLEQEGIQVVAEARDGEEAIRLAGEQQPDVAVIDFAMPRLNGVDAAQEIRKVSPETRTILRTMHTENQYLLEALRAGFQGCVLKTQAATELVEAVRAVSRRGGIYLGPGVPDVIVQAYLK